MKVFLLLILFVLNAAFINAQSLEFDKPAEILPHSIFAARNLRVDSKGKPCGVLMVHSTIEDLRFKGQIEGNVDYDSGIYYVYLHQGTTKLDIEDISGSITQIELPKIEPKTTYEITIFKGNNRGSLTCKSDPSGASVIAILPNDTIYLGRTPLKQNVKLLTGIYTIKVSKKGYKTKIIQNVNIKANKTTKLGTVKLKRQ